MARFLLHDFCKSARKTGGFLLALAWSLGLFSGCVLFLHGDQWIPSLMRQAAECQVSIVGLVNVTLFPFLFSAFTVYLAKPWLLAAVVWGKACSFSFVSLWVMHAFGSAGWLVYPLLMFSDLCMAVLLWCYWLRYAAGERGFSLKAMTPYLIALFLIGSVDYCLVSPFLVML